MSTFQSITSLTEEKISKLFNDNGAFFAFSKKQFEESQQPGVTYVTLASGLNCPKENALKIVEDFNKIHTDGLKEQVALFGAKRIIEHEYFNHETQISGDVQQVIDVLSEHTTLFPDLFTIEIIEQVARACFQKAIDNDWF